MKRVELKGAIMRDSSLAQKSNYQNFGFRIRIMKRIWTRIQVEKKSAKVDANSHKNQSKSQEIIYIFFKY